MVVQNVDVRWNNAHIAIYNALACTAQVSNAECNKITASRIVLLMYTGVCAMRAALFLSQLAPQILAASHPVLPQNQPSTCPRM